MVKVERNMLGFKWQPLVVVIGRDADDVDGEMKRDGHRPNCVKM